LAFSNKRIAHRKPCRTVTTNRGEQGANTLEEAIIDRGANKEQTTKPLQIVKTNRGQTTLNEKKLAMHYGRKPRGNQERKLESWHLLYPHTYPQIRMLALVDNLVLGESTAPTPAIAADAEANRLLGRYFRCSEISGKKVSKFTHLYRRFPATILARNMQHCIIVQVSRKECLAMTGSGQGIIYNE
jgi:hypothetical protein